MTSEKGESKKPYMTPGAKRLFTIGMSIIVAILLIAILLRIAAG